MRRRRVHAQALDRRTIGHLRLPLQKFAEALIACGVFGMVYFGVAFAFGVPEVRATLSRFIKR